MTESSTDSANAEPAALARTPLHDLHRKLGARMVPFAGYDMPVQYKTASSPSIITRARERDCSTCRIWDSFLTGPDHETTARALEALIPAISSISRAESSATRNC